MGNTLVLSSTTWKYIRIYVEDAVFRQIFTGDMKTAPFPYVLAMATIYNNCWHCLSSDYIRRNILSYIYSLLQPFTSFVEYGDN